MGNLYDSMHAHPDIRPVMELLELVEPVDEFSQAVVLIRDCFSPNNTLRALSRKALRRLVSDRTALVAAYEVAVMNAAMDIGAKPRNFGDAMAALPAEKIAELKAAYQKQVDILMGRPLKR